MSEEATVEEMDAVERTRRAIEQLEEPPGLDERREGAEMTQEQQARRALEVVLTACGEAGVQPPALVVSAVESWLREGETVARVRELEEELEQMERDARTVTEHVDAADAVLGVLAGLMERGRLSEEERGRVTRALEQRELWADDAERRAWMERVADAVRPEELEAVLGANPRAEELEVAEYAADREGGRRCVLQRRWPGPNRRPEEVLRVEPPQGEDEDPLRPRRVAGALRRMLGGLVRAWREAPEGVSARRTAPAADEEGEGEGDER